MRFRTSPAENGWGEDLFAVRVVGPFLNDPLGRASAAVVVAAVRRRAIGFRLVLVIGSLFLAGSACRLLLRSARTGGLLLVAAGVIPPPSVEAGTVAPVVSPLP